MLESEPPEACPHSYALLHLGSATSNALTRVMMTLQQCLSLSYHALLQHPIQSPLQMDTTYRSLEG